MRNDGAGPRPAPLVSVVIATYHRPRVLRLAIESVLAGEVDDVEVLVVGDHCTDDTEAVVRGIGDPRIRWINLSANAGDQSWPNSVGAAAARGTYLAYLNHDDLWFPDHLSRAVARLDRGDADLAFATTAVVDPLPVYRLRAGDLSVKLAGRAPGGRYVSGLDTRASAWVMRRELTARVGPWRPAVECTTASSQDWLFRARRAGATLVPTNELTVMVLASGPRPDCYLTDEDPEHEHWWGRIVDEPDLRRRLEAADRSTGSTPSRWRGLSTRYVHPVLARAGVHPKALAWQLRGRRRGDFINDLRRSRGLDPLPVTR